MDKKTVGQETYELPVKFTEEEREYYAAWGIREAQISNVCLVLFVFMLIWGIIATAIRLFGLFNENYWWYKTLVWSADIWVSVLNFVAAALVAALDLVLNILFNRRRPDFIKIVKIRIDDKSETLPKVMVELWKKRRLTQQEFTLENVEECFDVKNNAINLMGESYEIGWNTAEDIYENHIIDKYKALEHPVYHARAISDVMQMKELIDDYRAALEVKKKEAKWLREHGLKEE